MITSVIYTYKYLNLERAEIMRLKITKSLLAMGILATVIGSFGVQSVSALSPLVDENGHTVTTDTVEKNKELMNRYRWYDQVDNGDVVRDVKSRDHDVLEIVYTETGAHGMFGPKLTFSNTDIVYRMGWAIDTVVKPVLEKTKYNADDAVSFTTPNGIPVHTLGSSNDSVQIAYWEKDNKVYMLYFASPRNQNYVSKIVDSVGPLTNVAADNTRLRGDRNDKQNGKRSNAQSVKQNGEQDRPHFETIGLPLRTHTNSEWPILTSKSIGLPSGVIDASRKLSYNATLWIRYGLKNMFQRNTMTYSGLTLRQPVMCSIQVM